MAFTASKAASANALLAALDPQALARLRPRLSPVSLDLRQKIYEAEGPVEHVYFLESGMVSMVATMDDGSQAEVGAVGREGMVGTSLVGGSATSFVEAMVQMPGAGWRMTARDFRQEFEDSPALRGLVLSYNEALHNQVIQTAACNSCHELDQRLARWLLICHDRQDGDVLPLTQEFIAMMLGVHRPSVTVTAGLLQRAGVIRYGAGRITVLDRASLEAAACECYATVRRRCEAVAPAPRPNAA